MPSHRSKARAPTATTAPIDLALQGGGSHGAFTWGVLDRMLEDEGLPIAGVSGTSAGALNAAVLATGLTEGGREGARRALAAFWHDVACSGGCFGSLTPQGATANPWLAPWAAMAPPGWSELWTGTAQAWQQAFASALTSTWSPYQYNPLGLNPLRDLLARHVREDALRRAPVKLFITATAVRTGQPRVFHRHELTLDALLASACLPQLFKAVMIPGPDGGAPQPYWDGGYSGNPALWPLIYETEALDLLLVRINPLVHTDLPDTALEIEDRLNEITFNEVLIGELRAIHFVQKLVEGGSVGGGYKNLRLHMVGDDEHLGPLPASSKLSTDAAQIQRLFGWGRAAADDWLARNRGAIGVAGTVDIYREFLEPR